MSLLDELNSLDPESPWAECLSNLGGSTNEEISTEFERQGISKIDDIDFEAGEISLSDTTARVHIAALDDSVLQAHLRKPLQFERLSPVEQNDISMTIYIANMKRIPLDKKQLHLKLVNFYEKKFFTSFRYLISSQKTKAAVATKYMVDSFTNKSQLLVKDTLDMLTEVEFRNKSNAYIEKEVNGIRSTITLSLMARMRYTRLLPVTLGKLNLAMSRLLNYENQQLELSR